MDEETANYIEVKQGDGTYLLQISLNTGLQRRNPTKPITNSFKGKKILENDKIISFLGEHTHDSDLLKKRVRELEKHVVKESSGNIAISPRTVLGNFPTKG